MPRGRPTKWATAHVTEGIALGKSGIRVVIWDKWGRKRRGQAVISVGGLRWKAYKAKRFVRIPWDQIDRLVSAMRARS